MENALKNREEYYRVLQERLKEHVRIHNSSFASNFIVLCVLHFLNMSSTTLVVSQLNTRNDRHLYVLVICYCKSFQVQCIILFIIDPNIRVIIIEMGVCIMTIPYLLHSMYGSNLRTSQKPGTSKTGFGQVKLMKEFV